MKKALLMILGLLLINSLFSKELLIRIDFSEVSDLNLLETWQIRTIYQNQKSLYSVFNDDKTLQTLPFPWHLIDIKNNEDLYVLLTIKQKGKTQWPALGKNLYSEPDLRIMRVTENEYRQLQDEGYNPVEPEYSRLFQNTRINISENSFLRDDQLYLANSVNADSLRFFMQKLEDFRSRYALKENRFAVAEWIKSQFIRFGYTNTIIDTFFEVSRQVWQPNVIAILEGSESPNEFIVIGGHHDSTNRLGADSAMVSAPGADDNASGTAAVLEMARLFKSMNYQPKTSIRFCTYAMEEFGLKGSKYDARKDFLNNTQIRAMINYDMISNIQTYQDTVTFRPYSGSEFMTDLAISMIHPDDSLAFNFHSTENSSASDSWSYWSYGWPVLFFIENNFCPYYHTSSDLVVYTDKNYHRKIITVGTRVLLHLADLLPKPENFKVFNTGSGQELKAVWSSVLPGQSVSYKIILKDFTAGDQIMSEQTISDTAMVFSNLIEGHDYQIELKTINEDRQSLIQTRMLKCQTVPEIIISLKARTLRDHVYLNWEISPQIDISEYVLNKTKSGDNTSTQITITGRMSDFYEDFALERGKSYFYTIQAIDSQGHLGLSGNPVEVRLPQLNKGILCLNIIAPNVLESEIITYNDDVFSDYNHINRNIIIQDQLDLSELTDYSTICLSIPYMNYTMPCLFTEELKQYLDFGGNLIINSALPLILFTNMTGETVYENGSFIFDYLGIHETSISKLYNYSSVEDSLNFYPVMETDPDKCINFDYQSWNGFQTLQPNDQSLLVYTSVSQALGTHYPVAVSHSGENYHTAVFSVPFYYMKTEHVKDLIAVLLKDFKDYNALLPVHSGSEKVFIKNVWPNPFNTGQNILCYQNAPDNYRVDIFNIKGQKVRTIENNQMKSGYSHNFWDGKNDNKQGCASGIYFIRMISAKGKSEIQKVTLIR